MSKKYKVLITGCSSGLGKHLAKKFEFEGHKVMRHNGRGHYDISDLDAISALCLEAKRFGVDALVNNAAIVCPSLQFENYDTQMICNMIDVNLRAPIILTNTLIGDLKKVVNINSMVGLEVKSPRTLYSATKWGLRGFSNSLKKENSNLSVLDVYPTNIQTTPDRLNAMDIDMVVNKIYESFMNDESELVLDGRKQ